jgi:Uma2 family endonuclease
LFGTEGLLGGHGFATVAFGIEGGHALNLSPSRRPANLEPIAGQRAQSETVMHANALPPPRPHRVTTQEFFRMGEAGVLDPEARIELIEGEMIDMPPIAPPHASRTKRLTLLLIEAVGRRAIVSTQDPILLGDLSAPQPDIAILKPRDDFYSSEHPQAEDVLLVIEVADSSVRYDRTRKLPLYARYGIPEVWLIDIPARAIRVHRAPENGAYRSSHQLGPPYRISPSMLDGVELELGALVNDGAVCE